MRPPHSPPHCLLVLQRILNLNSVDTCNTLFEIENEYGAVERKVGSAFQAVEMAGDTVNASLRDILQDHDRNRVSKRIPPLLSRALPSWLTTGPK